MRNRVGKLVVATLLAMLVVFGVAVSAMAADVKDATFENKVLVLTGNGTVNAWDLAQKVAGSGDKITTSYRLVSIENGQTNEMWASNEDLLNSQEVKLFENVQYQVEKSVRSGWPVSTSTTYHDFTVKIEVISYNLVLKSDVPYLLDDTPTKAALLEFVDYGASDAILNTGAGIGVEVYGSTLDTWYSFDNYLGQVGIGAILYDNPDSINVRYTFDGIVCAEIEVWLNGTSTLAINHPNLSYAYGTSSADIVAKLNELILTGDISISEVKGIYGPAAPEGPYEVNLSKELGGTVTMEASAKEDGTGYIVTYDDSSDAFPAATADVVVTLEGPKATFKLSDDMKGVTVSFVTVSFNDQSWSDGEKTLQWAQSVGDTATESVTVAVTGADDNTYVTGISITDDNGQTVNGTDGKVTVNGAKAGSIWTVNVTVDAASITVPDELYVGPVENLSDALLQAKASVYPDVVKNTDLTVTGKIFTDMSVEGVKAAVITANLVNPTIHSVDMTYSYVSKNPLVGNISGVTSKLWVNGATTLLINQKNPLVFPYGTSADEVKAKIKEEIDNGNITISSVVGSYGPEDNKVTTNLLLDNSKLTAGNLGNTYYVIYDDSNDLYPAGYAVVDVTVDDRIVTTVNLKDGLEVTYSESLTAEDILKGTDDFEGVFISVTDPENQEVPDSVDAVKISGNVAAGTQTFKVTYPGTSVYKSSSSEVTVTIHKADATIDVTSKVVNYGTNPGSMITVSPKQAAYISFYAGLNAEGKNTVIHVNLPHLVDNEELINSPFYQGIINAVGSNQISLAQLSGVLSQMLESAETLAPILNIDTTSINMLVSALNQISQLEGVGDVKIELSIGDAKLPTDAGAYLVGAVVSDANYNTAVDLGYLVIKPNATRVDLGFVIEDDNFIVTRAAILSGDYDLGSYVEKGNLTDEQHRAAEAELVNVYAGVTVDGEIYLKNERPDEIGAYTQVAYIQDLGNDMYYAVPIARAFVIVADMVDVKFIDENGNVNHLRRFTYDGDGKRMTAKAYRKGTNNELSASDITYYYIGVEGDAEGFFAKNPTGSKLPTEAGAYTVIATYINDDQSLVGVAIGEMVIEPAQADIDVSNKLVEWTGSQVGVTDMVKKNPSDAAATIIVATVNVAGDFSEDGFSALAGVVNFDLPARMDEVVKQIMPDAYANGVSISTVKDKLADAIDWMGESDVAQLEKLQELVNKIDNSVTITFKETKDVDTNDIGMYLVIGAITDPNYRVDADAGLLVIAPDVDTAELKWNYNDANNVITLPALDIVDMGAAAYDNSGAKVDELSEKIDYIYIGVDERGNTVFVKNPSSLSTGLYTEIAYIYEREVSANMWVVKPIMRNVLIVAQSVDVDVPNKSVTYGESYTMDVTVTTRDNSYDAKYLTVTYTGLNTDGGYHSTTKPTEIGVYSVVATYIVRNDNGDVKYFGMDTGLLTIKPKTSSVEVRPTEKVYNGQQQMADIHNPDNLTLIKVVVDADKNINILLPDSVYSGTKTFDVSSALTGLETELVNLDEDVLDTLITVIQNVNARLGTLSINGTDMPVEVGTYTVYAIGYAANTVPSYDFDQLVITSPAPTATVEPTATPTAEPTATVGTPTPAPTDPTATVDPNATATPAPTDPTATVDPNATATPAPTDPTATVDPNATATPAPTDPTATMDPNATATPAPTDPTATVDPNATATPAPTDPTATVDPNATATPAPMDPTATVDPNATATPAPVDPDATATPAPTATAAPEATATTAPTEEPTATPKPLPETGDSSHNALWMLMLLFSGAALLLVCRKMTAAGR